MASGGDTEEWNLPFVFSFAGRMIRYGVMGHGTPLVLLHGTPFSSVVWRRIARHLAPFRQIFYFDLLGYGRSDMIDGDDVSLGIQNGVFVALLDHWGIHRPDVVAHDFGGATALRTHLLDGRDYQSLTLIDPVAIAPWGSPFVRHVRTHEAAFASLPSYIHAAIVPAYISGAAHQPMRPADLALYVDPWLSETGRAGFYRQIAQMDQCYTDEIAPHLAAIRCPVSILWGENDTWIPIERGRALASKISGARFKTIPNAGHLVQEDAPEAIVAELLGSLQNNFDHA